MIGIGTPISQSKIPRPIVKPLSQLNVAVQPQRSGEVPFRRRDNRGGRTVSPGAVRDYETVPQKKMPAVETAGMDRMREGSQYLATTGGGGA